MTSFTRGLRGDRYFRRSWNRACYLAGVGQLDVGTKAPRALKLRHDFRRTAVRNLERANVPRSVAMWLVGHKTQSIYSRYAIASQQDLKDGVAKLAALHQAATALPRQVVSLRAAMGEGSHPSGAALAAGSRSGRVSKNGGKPRPSQGAARSGSGG